MPSKSEQVKNRRAEPIAPARRASMSWQPALKRARPAQPRCAKVRASSMPAISNRSRDIPRMARP